MPFINPWTYVDVDPWTPTTIALGQLMIFLWMPLILALIVPLAFFSGIASTNPSATVIVHRVAMLI